MSIKKKITDQRKMFIEKKNNRFKREISIEKKIIDIKWKYLTRRKFLTSKDNDNKKIFIKLLIYIFISSEIPCDTSQTLDVATVRNFLFSVIQLFLLYI